MNEIYQYLKDLFKKNKDYISEEGELLIYKIVEDARLQNKDLIKFLIKDKKCKEYFFEKIDDITIFKSEEFRICINDARFLGNSFTRYLNKIGLMNNYSEKMIMNEDYIVLNYYYKDCILDGGMTKEEAKRTNKKETMINNVIFKNDIHKLKSPKAFKNFRKFSLIDDKVKESKVEQLTGKENLLINGNNFSALCCLKEKFAGKVKLIYIDPPYNTGNDTFTYNDNFNHSSWLVFMRDRLKIAKELLKEDGVIFIQCDDNEQAYLKVLMDEIFLRENFITTLHVELSTTQGMKIASAKKGNIVKNGEFILVYAKNIYFHSFINLLYASKQWDEHYSIYINPKTKERDTLLNFLKPIYKDISKDKIIDMYENSNDFRDFIHKNADNIYQEHNAEINFNFTKEQKIKLDNGKIIEYDDYLIFKNSNNKIRQFLRLSDAIGYTDDFDEEFRIRKIRGDWWAGYYKDMGNVNKQGDIIFKNGKKPERLIKDILKISTNEGDLILDFFAGSGTTLSVAHKMKRQYIGIEQIERHFDICIERLKKVIEGEQGGISKKLDWTGGGEFICCDIATYNADWIKKINSVKSDKEFSKLFEEMKGNSVINHRLKIDYLETDNLLDDDFNKKDLQEKKSIMLEILDKNMFYVPFSERKDKIFGLDNIDISLSEEFYKK